MTAKIFGTGRLTRRKNAATLKRLQDIAYNGLYVGSARFNNVRTSPAGIQARDAYTGEWSLLDTEEMTDHNGRKVAL